MALINTHVAAATGLVVWVIIDAIRGHISISGACVGPVVGLVAITPACGFVQPGWGILIGAVATCIVYGLLLLKKHVHFDDTLDVAIVHGCGMIYLIVLLYIKSDQIFFFLIGGISGALMTGLFCQKWVNEEGGADGAFYGRPIQLWYQLAGVLTAIGK
jgi:Amt family ammonium transporter